MVESNFPQPENNPRIHEILEPLFAEHHRQKCYPGLIFTQGKRKMIQINVPADDIPTLMQAKPSEGNDPDSGKNRPEVKGHADEVKDYILKRVKSDKPWILGTLTANVDPDPKKIKVIELGRGICIVAISRGVKLDITDGQHRKRAIHELIVSSEDAHLIADNDFPITLVLEGDDKQCQTDFRDMAQTKPLDKSLLLSFGLFEGRVGITKNIVDSVPMFEDKTEKIKGSPSTKNKLIYTMNYIAKFVSCSFANDPSNELRDYDVVKCSSIFTNCLEQFFKECQATSYISETNVNDLEIEDIAKFKDECLLGKSVGLDVLGHLLYKSYNKYAERFEPEKVSQLAQLDWSMGSSLWQDNIVKRDPNPKNPDKPYRISAGASAIRMAVDRAISTLGWGENKQPPSNPNPGFF